MKNYGDLMCMCQNTKIAKELWAWELQGGISPQFYSSKR